LRGLRGPFGKRSPNVPQIKGVDSIVFGFSL